MDLSHLRIDHEREPECPRFEISRVRFAHPNGNAGQARLERDAAFQVGDSEGQVIDAGNHAVIIVR